MIFKCIPGIDPQGEAMTILIGCSGWSYEDWVGRFYPVELAQRRGEWLQYYAGFFRSVEINSTFYRPAGPMQISSWIRKAAAFGDGFEYSVKVPGSVTHRALLNGEIEQAVSLAESFERECLEPLHRAGLLGAVLIQLHPGFRSCDSSRSGLIELLERISTQRFQYAVEFRHESWAIRKGSSMHLEPELAGELSRRGVAVVMTDGPQFPGAGEMTEWVGDTGGACGTGGTDEGVGHAYLRFHGRNRDLWHRGNKTGKSDGTDHRLNRYDYLYKEDELIQWLPRISREALRASRVRVYFNNHARAKAAKNAFQLMDMLGIEHASKQIPVQEQFTLGEFGPRCQLRGRWEAPICSDSLLGHSSSSRPERR